MNLAELTGQARTHVNEVPEFACSLHVDTIAAFRNLRREAVKFGFELSVVSGFRDFSRQLHIWNAKYRGVKPLYDADGGLLDTAALTPAELISAILLWSALPGASRHHWGTDLDLVDAKAIPANGRPELSQAEFAVGGPFAPLAEWLEANAARYGFFTPFRGIQSGVRAEPWHYSFAPVAEAARRALTPETLRMALLNAPLEGKAQVLSRLDELHARYVAAIDWP